MPDLTAARRSRGARRSLLLTVAAVALAVRLVVLLDSRGDPLLAMALDAPAGDAWARRIAAGDLDGGSSVFSRPPLYPYLLAGIYRLGWEALGVRLVHSLLGATTAVLVAALGARLLGTRAGMLAGLAAALYGPALAFEAELQDSAIVLALSTGALLLFECSREMSGSPRAPAAPTGMFQLKHDHDVVTRPRRLGRLALAGLCFGLLTLARPEALFVALVLGCGLLIRERRDRRIAFTCVTAFLGTAILVSLLATARNWAVARDPVWVSADRGIHFYVHNNPDRQASPPVPGSHEWERILEMPHREAGLTRAAQRSRFFYRRAWQRLAAEPQASLRHLLTKAGRFLAGVEIASGEDPYRVQGESRLLGLLVWRAGTFGFPFGIVAPLALLGALLLWRRRSELASIYLYAAATGMVSVAFAASSASRLLAMPAFLLFAAGAVGEMMAMRRTRGAVIGWAGALVLFALVLNTPPVSPHLDRDPLSLRLKAARESERGNARAAVEAQQRAIAAHPRSAELHFELGLYRSAAADTPGAVAAYQQAIDLDPDYGEPRVNLGNLLVARGDFAAAVRQYFEATVTDPDLVPAQIAAGNALLHSGHPDSALVRYDRALALEPGSLGAALGRIGALERLARFEEAIAEARRSRGVIGESAALLSALGRVLKNAGRLEEAVPALRQALKQEPERVEAWVTLGQCYRRLGQLEEAEAANKRALAIDPGLTTAHVNLADIYARRGLYDQAIAALERALVIEPFNPTAIYNLAIVHHALGQDAQAVLMLENLLAIDPDHDAGRHALAEIRGEPAPELHHSHPEKR